MAEPAISIEGLGKCYRIGGRRERYHTLRESLVNVTAGLWQSMRGLSIASRREDFWALKDVSFDVQPGEVVGIIGRNGAGKSTLLKILSEITEPTEGRALMNGRVGSLLEVGTGFHPELTGRENIYLSGAILGMRKAEIAKKFDEIVEFSGVEKFLDTPCKHYSSGMYVRLGFAVAAHLEPEILVVDEVLAVGDMEFQKKCLGKMGEVAKSGRTVLFVSHNMAAVQSLCSRGILISDGRVAHAGAAEDVISRYVQAFAELPMAADLKDFRSRSGEGPVRLQGFRVLDEMGSPISACQSGQRVLFEICYTSSEPLANKNVVVSIGVRRSFGDDLFTCNTKASNQGLEHFFTAGLLRCRIDRLPLSPGRYPLLLRCFVNDRTSDYIAGATALQVVEGDFFGAGRLPSAHRSPVLVPHAWTMECLEAHA